jgi:cobyrinic acid a,c-diamide synthase
VVLVVDASSSARSIGAVVKGFATFDPQVDVRGVIFNRIAGERHLSMLEDAISGTGLISLGGLPKEKGIELDSRHLGLVPATESSNDGRYDLIKELVEEHLDIDALIEMANGVEEWELVEEPRLERLGEFDLAVAFDDAFNFYYEDNLDIMRALGANICKFSPMKDPLPDADGYYFGGGYPELHLDALERNEGNRTEILSKIVDGVPVYAECGGMMYLCDKVLGGDGRSRSMVGAFKADVRMTERCQAIGYAEVRCRKDCLLAKSGHRFRGHVFHYSRVERSGDVDFAYIMDRNKGIDGSLDGFVRGNALASYTHVHLGSDIQLARNWAESCLGGGHRSR